MGILKVGVGAAQGVLADSWREYFYCDAMDVDVLAKKGEQRQSKRGFNTKKSENIISNGSIIVINEGQCMMIVEQGKVVEVCAEAGEFLYDSATEPSLFYGDLKESIKESFRQFGKRVGFGGDPAGDQRIYYFNTKEILGNKYGTSNPVPFRVVDTNIGLDIDIAIRCHGEYAYHIIDPILFYKNICGNITDTYTRDSMESQLKSEMLTALQPAFGKLSAMGIRYSALPAHTMELSQALNEVLAEKWGGRYGIEITSIGVSSVKASDEDEAMIKELQRNATLRNPSMAAAHLVGAQAAAMQSAASNQGAGPAMAFMGMNMAGQMGGMNAQNLYQMGAQQQAQQPAPAAPAAPTNGWTCSCGQSGITGNFCPNCGSKKPEPKPAAGSWKCPQCGATATGKFCPECGTKKPESQADGWTCSCGAVNKGKFCAECGRPRPAAVKRFKCDKCGWEPEDPTNPPKFCPECGDPFNDGDSVS